MLKNNPCESVSSVLSVFHFQKGSIMNDWFEIFRTGTHTDTNGNTCTWTEADLDTIVGRYNAEVYEAPIVIGHPATDAPAYGWIEKLERAGDVLLAKAKQLVPEFVELVRQGMYKKVSIAITPDYDLRHVGFLGAAAPAVSGLIPAQFTSGEELIAFESNAPAIETPAEDEADKKEEELQSRIDELEQKFAQSDADKKKLQEILYEQEQKKELLEFQSYLDAKVAAGVLSPAQKELAARLVLHLASAPEELKEDASFAAQSGDTVIKTFRMFIELLPNHFSFGEMAVKKNRSEKEPHSDVDYAGKLINSSMKSAH